MYKIGKFKNGQQIAKEVFARDNIREVELEFKRMWKATEFCPEGTDNEAEDENEAWERKRFSEDTNNVAVFEVEDGEALHTNYTYAGCTSKIMR